MLQSEYPPNHLTTTNNVFVPSVVQVEDDTVSEPLKIFTHFFSITDQDDLNKFVQTYKDDPLTALLMLKYSEAVNRVDLDQIIGKEYFTMKSAEALKMEYLEKNRQADARLAQANARLAQIDREANERLAQVNARLAQVDAEESKLQANIKSFSDKIVAIVKKLYVNSCPVEEISDTVGISQTDVRNILGLTN